MNWNFDIREFCITDEPVPQGVADKIFKYHMNPMQVVRERLEDPIIVSRRSGYRPVKWELERGRNGNSQHTFRGKGAADYRINSDNWGLLLCLIKDWTEYSRICIYPNNSFIHCDYASDKRIIYRAESPAGSWYQLGELDDVDLRKVWK